MINLLYGGTITSNSYSNNSNKSQNKEERRSNNNFREIEGENRSKSNEIKREERV